MRRFLYLVVAFPLFLAPAVTWAGERLPPDFRPDPLSVQRYGPAYRYPQAGWIVLHIEGEPYERGVQHGRLLAPEIAAHVRCFAAVQSPKAPAEGWRHTRTLVNALFLRRYEKEFLEEMKGIADGASAAGAKFDGRPIDLLDVVALNSVFEVETLDGALEATATGLEGPRFSQERPKAMPKPKPMHCSAFAATGPATADGKIVFGHITMFGLYQANFYNVWLDVKPTRGHRVFMQTYPGGIQSGLDYYFNDAGLLVCETTLAQTKFDIKGMTVASRIRQALQYADSIDKAADILKAGNNGLYTNEWLLGDVKTNEIAMFELGTHKSKLYRSSKGEWFGGTKGFYWGCNNTKDLEIRLETIASTDGRPANATFHPSDRDKTWLRLYDQYKGKIDADFGKLAFTTPPLAAYHSVDAKFTTSDLAKELKTWAVFGPPLGRTWEPSFHERQQFPEIQPLVGNPWVVLHANPPPAAKKDLLAAIDLHDPERGGTKVKSDEGRRPPTQAAWHGTILPKTDADVWLAAAFADYEKIVALEKALLERSADSKLSASDRDRLALALFGFRSEYELGARAHPELPLAKTTADVRQDDWYRVAAGKGTLLLHALRGRLGAGRFDDAMDAFGRENAGKPVTVAQFQGFLEKATGQKLDPFFQSWLGKTGLPTLQLAEVRAEHTDSPGSKYEVRGVLRCAGMPAGAVDVTVETASGEETVSVVPTAAGAEFHVAVNEQPRRVVVGKYAGTIRSKNGPFAILTWHAELDQTLIVYGTADETSTNQEAAELLQKAIITRHSNFTVPIKADRDVTDEDLRTHHLLLIGRPDSNRVVRRFRDALPLTFGDRSFTVRGETYAHAGSAVLAAAENPLQRRYSLVVIAGLDGASTRRVAPMLLTQAQQAEVVVVPHGGTPKGLVIPAKDLIHDFAETRVGKK